MKYCSKEHEWVKIQGERATVGITQYAAEELGDITYVELPEVGAEYEQGEAMAVVESVKAASDVFAPVSGRVSALNEDIIDHPEMVNESPEEEGWFCELEGVDENDLDNLMTYEEYLQYVELEKVPEDDEKDDVDEEE